MVSPDISETTTLQETQDVHEPVPVPFEICGAPSNYVRVYRHLNGYKEAPISGQYLIDLSLPPVPRSLLHVVSASDNLFLYTTNGPVTADVWVTGNNRLRRVSMKIFTDNGNIWAKVHNAFSGGEGERRPSLDIGVRAKSGDVSLSLPRCFRGLIRVKCSHQDISFSPAFKKRTALLSEDKNVCVYFVGDRPRSWTNGEEGTGAGRYPEEPLDKLSVVGLQKGWVQGRCPLVWIRYDGESGSTF